jgi:hypothetical protein
MDFSKLNPNEKLAVYGAIASVVGPILATAGFGFGVGIFTLLLALAMLAIVFLPQWSPQTTLPGSKGSLMLLVGGIAAVSAALALIGSIGLLSALGSNVVFVIGWLVGIAGGLLMGWAGWQEFQAEGGKFQLGTPTAGSGTTTTTTTTTESVTAPPPAAPGPAPTTPAPTTTPTPPAATAAPEAEPPRTDPEDRPPA